MIYSIKAILLPYKSKEGQQVVIQIIHNRKKVFQSTPYRSTPKEFIDGEFVEGKNRKSKNAHLLQIKTDIEDRLITAIKSKKSFDLKIVKEEKDQRGEVMFHEWIYTYAEEFKVKVKDTTHDLYLLLAREIEFYNIPLVEVNVSFLLKVEKGYGRHDNNTIHKKMKNIKKFLIEAGKRSMIDSKQFDHYQVPVYLQKIPEFLEEHEILLFKAAADKLYDENLKIAGYYFLLSCYAGYRISDCKSFKYEERIKANRIILRAKKNGEIVSIPIYKQLIEILEYIKDKPLTLAEPIVRDHVYAIAKSAGVDRKITYHTSRHTFGMLLTSKDFTIEDVAELMGITVKTARIYARVTNKRLERMINEKFG
jgi:integrase